MKKELVAVILIMTGFSLSFAGITAVQTEDSKTFYDGVTKIAQWTYVDGKRGMQGVTITGQVKVTANFDNNERFAMFNYLRNGIVDGSYTWCFSDTQKVSAVENYASGRIDGFFKAYFKSGRIAKKGTYKAGKKEGEWITYYGNGEIAEVANYVNDMKNGDYVKNYETGANNVTCRYINNKIDGKYVELYDSGTMKLEGNYTSGLRDGDFTMYYESGEKQYVMRYKTGKVLGAINETGDELAPVETGK
jgi:uncharacterized protein